MGFGMKLLGSLVEATVSSAERRVGTVDVPISNTHYSAPAQTASAQPSLEDKQKALLAKYKKENPAVQPVAATPSSTKTSSNDDYYSPHNIGERFLAQCPEYKLTDNDVRTDKEMDEYVNYVFGYVALCNYLIHIEVARIIGCLRRTKEIPTKYRNSFSNAMISSVMTFDDVRKYLDKADSSHLIYLATRAQDIAEISGLTDKEQMAVDSFKYYVEQKTGHRFDHIYNEKAPVDLRCPSCAGTMKLDKTMAYAVCKFCGYTKVFDANRLPAAEKERIRSEKLQAERDER